MKKLLVFLIMLPIFARGETFDVALPMLPKVNPITNQINVGTYIGGHLYYPLFVFKDNNATFESYFLNTQTSKATDKSFKRFQLCLKKNLKFSDNSEIKPKDLALSLKSFFKMYPQIANVIEISEKDECAFIDLRESVPGLFNKLTGVASTIVKNGNDVDPFPIGKGPYKLESPSKDLLVAKSSDSHIRFETIKFHLVKNDTAVEGFEDLNQLPPNASRDDLIKGTRIKVPSLKVYSLVLNLRDKKRREQVASFVSKVNWIDFFGLKLKPTSGFLPWDHRVARQNSDVRVNTTKSKKVPLLISEIYDLEKLKLNTSFQQVQSYFNIVYLSSDDFAKWAFSGKEYVALMGFDSSGSMSSMQDNFSVYFESFYSEKNRIVSDKIEVLADLIAKSLDPKLGRKEQETFIEKAESILINEFYVFPIGRVERQFIFPDNILISNWLDFYSGIPDVSRIQ